MFSNPNLIYGIHSVTPYDRTTRQPISFLRVLGEASLNLNAEFEELKGGSNMYSWDAEPKEITSEFSFTCKEYPITMMQKLLAGVVTDYTEEVAGEIVDVENVNGDSVYDSSTGIATVAVSTAADLKEGEYVVKATAANKVSVYAMSNVNFDRGSALEINDSMEVGTDFSIVQSSGTIIAGLGVTLTGGSGTIGFETDDTFRFRVRRPLVSGVKMIVGSSNSSFSEFGCIVAGQKKSDGSLTYLDIYKCRAAGMPISFKEKAYSEWSLSIKVLYDSVKDAVFEYILNK